jgi:hypothetical protein
MSPVYAGQLQRFSVHSRGCWEWPWPRGPVKLPERAGAGGGIARDRRRTGDC